MDKLASIVQQLQQKRARIDAALQALTGVSHHRGAAHRGRRNQSPAACYQPWLFRSGQREL
jgi:hypothetical protein